MHRNLKQEKPIPPPAMLGVIGGGQLGMFFTQAAVKMGYPVAVLDPDPHSPAMAFATERILAPYENQAGLERMASLCAAITIEFESVPAASVRQLESVCVTAPSADSISVLQDRVLEKDFLRAIGLTVAPYLPVLSAADLEAPGCYPGILKLARQSYDGKGQAHVANAQLARAAWKDLGESVCVLEKKMTLDCEFSVVIARGATGQTSHFPIAKNIHNRGILQLSVVPANISAELEADAVEWAKHIAFSLDYVGVLAVEYFIAEGQLLVNEIAPRPHNSGHYTLEATTTSQFEQQVRALCGLPLGETTLLSPAAMVNVLGEAWCGGAPDWSKALGNSGGRLHLYGKSGPRPGRKMAHITVLHGDPAVAAREATACLRRLHRESVHSKLVEFEGSNSRT